MLADPVIVADPAVLPPVTVKEPVVAPDAMVTLAKGFAFVLVWLAPWLVVLGVVGWPVWLVLRKRMRKSVIS